MEGVIPGGKPGILPFIGHDQNIFGLKMGPSTVAHHLAIGFAQPFGYVVAIKLLCPQQAAKRLTQNSLLVVGGGGGGKGRVVGIRFGFAGFK